MEITDKHIKRFWPKVKKGDNCWIWIAGKSGFGYGAFYVDSQHKSYPAHRISWIIANGSIPDGLFVCHKCDIPSCVNPSHLFLGTQADNMKDMSDKLRRAKGEDSASAKVTWETISEIRKIYQTGQISQRELGKQFGLDQTQISNIVKNRQWVDDSYKNNITSVAYKMNFEKAQEARKLVSSGLNQTQVAQKFGVHKTLISLIVRNKIWKEVTK